MISIRFRKHSDTKKIVSKLSQTNDIIENRILDRNLGGNLNALWDFFIEKLFSNVIALNFIIVYSNFFAKLGQVFNINRKNQKTRHKMACFHNIRLYLK